MVPQDIRERKGSFFTPRQWVELSQEYMGNVFGEDWQDEYYIWDCAAGTGNLLAGLTNKYNIWASTLDKADVDVMKDRIKNGANLIENHVFQFDFLNDEFNKLPKPLKSIIDDPEKRKKLIVYINPPYAEDTNKVNRIKTSFKGKVAQNKIHDKYAHLLEKANHEIFAQFLTRIFNEIPSCKIANFSKLKALSSPNFASFRQMFKAKLEKLFVVPADTFDNVKGKFPIGFHVWDTNNKKLFKKIKSDVYNKDGDFIFRKNIWAYDNFQYINDWLKTLRNTQDIKKQTAILNYRGNDFQHESYIFIDNCGAENSTKFSINQNNLIEACIYFSMRKVIPADWLNDRDQFLYPNNGWKTDLEFQSNCLVYTLFNNNISCKYGTNHWIPFSETDVNAKDNFESYFMYDFIIGNGSHHHEGDLFTEKKVIKRKALRFSDEAKTVFKAGKKLWLYYHSQPSAKVNAGLHDIREFFQGRDDSGKMNNKSGDDTYTALIGDLRSALKLLALKIQPKVYEYGFLLE